MSNRKQTRRSVSISGDLYKALRERCDELGLPMSTYVEELSRSSIGMDPRDADTAARVIPLPKIPLRPKAKAIPAPEVSESKEPPPDPPSADSTPSLVPVPAVPTPDPEKAEDLLGEGDDPGVPDRPLPSNQNSPPETKLAPPGRKIWADEDRQRLTKPRGKVKNPGRPATPDAPDPATAEVLAERKAREESEKIFDDFAKERRKSFETWAKQHSTSAESLKPNGKRRNGNVHLL